MYRAGIKANWYKIGFDEACNAGFIPNPPSDPKSKAEYMRGFEDSRKLHEGN